MAKGILLSEPTIDEAMKTLNEYKRFIKVSCKPFSEEAEKTADNLERQFRDDFEQFGSPDALLKGLRTFSPEVQLEILGKMIKKSLKARKAAYFAMCLGIGPEEKIKVIEPLNLCDHMADKFPVKYPKTSYMSCIASYVGKSFTFTTNSYGEGKVPPSIMNSYGNIMKVLCGMDEIGQVEASTCLVDHRRHHLALWLATFSANAFMPHLRFFTQLRNVALLDPALGKSLPDIYALIKHFERRITSSVDDEEQEEGHQASIINPSESVLGHEERQE